MDMEKNAVNYNFPNHFCTKQYFVERHEDGSFFFWLHSMELMGTFRSKEQHHEQKPFRGISDGKNDGPLVLETVMKTLVSRNTTLSALSRRRHSHPGRKERESRAEDFIPVQAVRTERAVNKRKKFFGRTRLQGVLVKSFM